MEEVSREIYESLKDACYSCKSDTISLSGGLDSTIITYFLKERNPTGIAIISEDFVSTDLTYCQMAANQFNIPLIIHNVSTSVILEAIEETIKILKNFNDIEIRNNVVMYLAIKWAKDHDKKGIVTGDGADELFAGYSFLLNKPEGQLDQEIKRVCSIMHFPTQKIGKELGITIESPFLDKKITELAKKIPTDLKVRNEGERRYGKWILRKIFENKIPAQIAWRGKSPMQEGAGTAGLSNLFESIIEDHKFEEKKKAIQNSDNVIIRSKESMYYYEIFRKLYENPHSNTADACPYCKYDVKGSKFCRMCGSFPI